MFHSRCFRYLLVILFLTPWVAFGHGTVKVVESTLEGVSVQLNVNNGYGYALVRSCSNCTDSISLSVNPDSRFYMNGEQVTFDYFAPTSTSVVTVFYFRESNTVSRIKSNSH